MSSFDVNMREFEIRINELTEKMLDAAETAVQDAVDDLVLISSHIAPIDKDILRKSHTQKVQRTAKGVTGEVAYSVSERDGNGRFNYALAMHEWQYKPSHEGSFEGYTIGRKYLERPLMGEAEKYKKWIADEVKGATE